MKSASETFLPSRSTSVKLGADLPRSAFAAGSWLGSAEAFCRRQLDFLLLLQLRLPVPQVMRSRHNHERHTYDQQHHHCQSSNQEITFGAGRKGSRTLLLVYRC